MQYPEVPSSSKENKKLSVRRAICGILINEKGEIFLAKRTSKRTFNPDCFDLLGGGISEGEKPLQTFLRDAKDKIGVELEIDKNKIEDRGAKDMVYQNGTVQTHIYLCRIDSQTKITLDPKKYADWGWFTSEQIEQLKLSPKVLEVLTDIKLLK